MSIELDAQGKPHVRCPNCKRLHLVRRNKGYTGKNPQRFHCSHCKTSWSATDEQAKEILAIYGEHHENLRKKLGTAGPKRKQAATGTDNNKPAGFLSRVLGLEE